jgi:hypothetical protein
MAEEVPPPELDQTGADWSQWLKPARWLQFVRRVLLVESSIEALKAEAIALQGQVEELEDEVERLQAQLSILLPPLHGMVDDKVRIAVLDRVPELEERILRDHDRHGA